MIYFSSTLFIFFVDLLFFLNIKRISKWIYGKYNKNFVIYALIIFLFLPTNLQAGIDLKNDTIATFLYMLAIFYYLKLLESKETRHTIYLGIILGAGLLTRFDFLIIVGGFVLQTIFFHFKKENKMRNNLFWCVILSFIIGSGTFIKNLIFYKNIFGSLMYDFARSFSHPMSDFFRTFTAYWGDIRGK